MRYIRLLAVSSTLLILPILNPLAVAQESGFGIGAIFGEPTGISAKYWTDSRTAVDAGIAWSFHGDGFLHIHSDFLWHFPDVIKTRHRFPLYVGIGGRIRFDDPARVGVRIPGGISWWVDEIPLEVFLEIVPILDLTPKTSSGFNGGIGARYYI